MKSALVWLGTLVVFAAMVRPVSAQCNLDHVEVVDRAVRGLDGGGSELWSKDFGAGTYLDARHVIANAADFVVVLVQGRVFGQGSFVLLDCNGSEVDRRSATAADCGLIDLGPAVVGFDISAAGTAYGVFQHRTNPYATYVHRLRVDGVSGAFVDLGANLLPEVGRARHVAVSAATGPEQLVITSDRTPGGNYDDSQIAFYAVALIDSSLPCEDWLATSVVATAADPGDYASVDVTKPSTLIFSKDNYRTEVDRQTGDVIADNAGIESARLWWGSYFDPTVGDWQTGWIIAPQGTNLAIAWQVFLGNDEPEDIRVFDGGGVPRIAVVLKRGLLAIYGPTGRVLYSKFLAEIYVPDETLMASSWSLADSATAIRHAEITAARAVTLVNIPFTPRGAIYGEAARAWSWSADGEQWPRLPIGLTGVRVSAEGVIVEGDSRRVARVDTGYCIEPMWPGRFEVGADGRSLSAYDPGGVLLWTYPTSGRVIAAARVAGIQDRWVVRVLREMDSGAPPQVLDLRGEGTLSTSEGLVSNSLQTGQFVAFALEVPEYFAGDFFDRLIGVQSRDQTGYAVFALGFGHGSLAMEKVADHVEAAIDHTLLPKSVVVLSRGSEGDVVRQFVTRFRRPGPAAMTREFAFDRADEDHPLVTDAIELMPAAIADETVGIRTAVGDIFHLGDFDGWFGIGSWRLATVPIPPMMRSSGATVEWLDLAGVVVATTTLPSPALDIGLDGRGGVALLDLPGGGQQVWGFRHFLGAAPAPVEVLPLTPLADGSAYDRFVGNESQVVSSGSGFAYLWHKSSSTLVRQIVNNGSASFVRRQYQARPRLDLVAWTPAGDSFAALDGYALEPVVDPQPWENWTIRFDGRNAFLPANGPIASATLRQPTNVDSWMEIRFQDGELALVDRHGQSAQGQLRLSSGFFSAVAVGDTARIDVSLGDAAGLSRVRAENHYDPSLLEFLGVATTDSSVAQVTDFLVVEPGTVRWQLDWSDQEGFAASSPPRLQLLFRAVGTGGPRVSAITFDDARSVAFRRSGTLLPLKPSASTQVRTVCPGAPPWATPGEGIPPAIFVLRSIVGSFDPGESDVCWMDHDGDGQLTILDAILFLKDAVVIKAADRFPAGGVAAANWQWSRTSAGEGLLELSSEESEFLGFQLSLEVEGQNAEPVQLDLLDGGLSAIAGSKILGIATAGLEPRPARLAIGAIASTATKIAVQAGYAITADGRRVEWPAQVIELEGDETPVEPLVTALDQNRPNPFNPSTEIRYSLAQGQKVTLTVYDAAGRVVRRLEEGQRAAGPHTVSWRGDDDGGRPVASGVYWYRLTTVEGDQVRKMVLVR